MENGLRARRSIRPRSTSRRRLTAPFPSAQPFSESAPARRSRSSKQRHRSPARVASTSPRSHSPSNSTSSRCCSRSAHRPLCSCARRAMRQSISTRGAGSHVNEWASGEDDAGELGPMSPAHSDAAANAHAPEKGLAGDRLNIALLLFLYSLQGVPLGAYK